MVDENANPNDDESCGVEHLPQSELEASPGLSTPQTHVDMDKLPPNSVTHKTDTSDQATDPKKLDFQPQPDDSRGLEHLPQSELEASPRSGQEEQ